MMCVVCSCCATSPYTEVCRAKGGIGSGETLCHDTCPARLITTVSLAANTHTAWWTVITHAHLATWAPGSNLAVRVNRAIDDRPAHTAGSHLLSVVQTAPIKLSVSESSISQRSQIKEDTVEPSAPVRDFNLQACAAITWHNDPASPGLEPRLADHRSQAARTATPPMAPPGQAGNSSLRNLKICKSLKVAQNYTDE